MRRLAPAIAIALALFASEASAQTRQVFTPTSGPTCRDFSKESVGRWVCPGPAGHVAAFLDEGNLVEVAFGRPGRPFDRGNSGAVWRGAGKTFGDVLEWRVDSAGVPVAAILRTWEIDESEKMTHSLKVFAINPDGACLYTTVKAVAPRANERAAREAEAAYRHVCPTK